MDHVTQNNTGMNNLAFERCDSLLGGLSAQSAQILNPKSLKNERAP